MVTDRPPPGESLERIAAASRAEPYAGTLGLRCAEVRPGYARVGLEITPALTNLFGCAHGGAVFSLLDEAFQLACNSHGVSAYALNVNVTYVKGARPGDRLVAEARELALTRKTATYALEVRDAAGELIAHAQAVAYRTGAVPPFLTP
jgi:acyl-CoA thioesterase